MQDLGIWGPFVRQQNEQSVKYQRFGSHKAAPDL